jgi:hypothetical protein
MRDVSAVPQAVCRSSATSHEFHLNAAEPVTHAIEDCAAAAAAAYRANFRTQQRLVSAGVPSARDVTRVCVGAGAAGVLVSPAADLNLCARGQITYMKTRVNREADNLHMSDAEVACRTVWLHNWWVDSRVKVRKQPLCLVMQRVLLLCSKHPVEAVVLMLC